MKLSIPLFLSIASALSFTGRINGIPDSIDELFDAKHAVINGHNYQARIDVRLVSENLKAKALVDKDYKFEFDVLPGDYLLLINSFDFDLSHDKISIHVEDDIVTATDHTNTSVVIGQQELTVQFVGLKKFYDVSQSSIFDMVMNSPFGFIFQNTLYTMLFMMAIGVIVAPYLLSLVNPELAELLNNGQYQEEIDKTVAAEEAERAQKVEKIELVSETTSTGTNKNKGRRRK